MATYTKELFTESALGEPIRVTGTSSPGVLIHDLVDGYTDIDEVWIYASNTSASAVTLTIELGDSQLAHEIDQSIAANSTALIIPGVPMQGDGRIRAYAGTGSVINVFGWINKITA